MRTYWIKPNKEKRREFRRCAAAFKVRLPDSCDLIASAGEDGSVMGFAALSTTEASADILFFYVFEQYRRQGAARTMLQEIEKQLVRAGVAMLRFVLPRQEELTAFFRSEGYELFESDREYMFTYGALRYSPVYLRAVRDKNPGRAKPVKELDEKETRILAEFLRSHRLPDEGGLARELSIASIEGGQVKGLILCERAADGIRVVYVYAGDSGGMYGLKCFRALDRVMTGMGDDAARMKVIFSMGHERNRELARMFAQDDTQVEVINGVYHAVKNLL